MKGLELAREYYFSVGKPVLEAEFPEYLPRIAAGFAGEGSECLGYDDEISRDHDFGPGFCLWLTKEDYRAVGRQMQQVYQNLPGEFRGFGSRRMAGCSKGRVGVMEISSFYGRFIGNEQPPASLVRWLYLPEDKLAAAVSGEVFEDPLGSFSRIRQVLSGYYPEDVRVKKIAARAVMMAQSGQYNYGRCMRRGDVVAAGLAEAEFVRSALSMIYLLNRRYAPFYKWMFRGLSREDILGEALPLLKELSGLGVQQQAWSLPEQGMQQARSLPGQGIQQAQCFSVRGTEKREQYDGLQDRKLEFIEEICAMVVRELQRQGLTGRQEDFLEIHAWEVMERIQDPELRKRHVMEG